ncbi:hypothetical protein E4U61_006877 [Claviceps capensis]|nr:hypothetical protein E4U61_006877 [Claviceps capensis]
MAEEPDGGDQQHLPDVLSCMVPPGIGWKTSYATKADQHRPRRCMGKVAESWVNEVLGRSIGADESQGLGCPEEEGMNSIMNQGLFTDHSSGAAITTS